MAVTIYRTPQTFNITSKVIIGIYTSLQDVKIKRKLYIKFGKGG